MNISGQWFGLDMASRDDSSERETSVIIIICGEEKNNSLIVFGIGKIDLQSKNNDIVLFWKIEKTNTTSAYLNNKTNCSGIFNIIVTTIPIEKEQITQKSIQFVTDATCADYLHSIIGIVVALVISVLLNIVTFANKVWQKFSAKTEQNRNDPQVSPTMSNKDDEQIIISESTETCEMALAGEAGINPYLAVKKTIQQQESPFALRCKKRRANFLGEGNQNLQNPTSARQAISPTAHQTRGIAVFSKEAKRVLERIPSGEGANSHEYKNSHEYEPIVTPSQKVMETTLVGDKSVPVPGCTSVIVVDCCTTSRKTSLENNPSSPTKATASPLDQNHHHTYKNLKTLKTFCSSGLTEPGQLYEIVDVADQGNDYMPLQESDHGSDPKYQPLQI